MNISLNADTFTKAGAERLARYINQYWAAKGRKANARVERVDFAFSTGWNDKRIYCVRSDLKFRATP